MYYSVQHMVCRCVRVCCVNMPRAYTHVIAALTLEINITLFNIFATSCT